MIAFRRKSNTAHGAIMDRIEGDLRLLFSHARLSEIEPYLQSMTDDLLTIRAILGEPK